MPSRKARGRHDQQSSPVHHVDPALQSTQNEFTTKDQSEQDRGEINPEDVLLDLPSLYANADAILKLLVRCGEREGVVAALADTNSRLRQRMRQGQAQFFQQQALFKVASDNYIRPSEITKALFFDHDEAWEIAQQRDISLYDIIYKINVATFLYAVCDWHDISNDEGHDIELVRYNDEWFPSWFMSNLIESPSIGTMELLPIGTSRASPETLSLAVSMRTQLAIAEMHRAVRTSQGSDLSIILRELFYDTEGLTGPARTIEQLEQQPLRRWYFGTPLTAANAARVKEFIANVEQMLPDQNSSAAFESQGSESRTQWGRDLAEAYPWSGFVMDSAQWAQSRARELTTQIQLRGGAEEIISIIDTLRTDGQDAMLAFPRLSQPPPSAFASPQQTQPLLTTPQRAAASYAIQQPNFGGLLDVQRTPPVSQRAGDRLQANLTAFATKTIASMGSDEQPITSLLDTQPNGEKLSFQDNMPHAGQSPSKRKRGQEDDDIEVTPDRASKRFRNVHFPSTEPSPIRSSALGMSNTAGAGPSGSQVTDVELLATQLGDPGSQQQARLEAISQSYDSVKRAGKDIAEHRKAELKAEDDRKVQERKRWTREETTALIAYIEELGTSWAMIQKTDQGRGNVLQGRDQVALKDKARNLKFEYLKANAAVPKNFEGVSLSKSMKDKLEAWNGPIAHGQAEAQGQMHGM